MWYEQSRVGKKVRVRGDRRRPELRGTVVSVLRCYGEPEYLALEVELMGVRGSSGTTSWRRSGAVRVERTSPPSPAQVRLPPGRVGPRGARAGRQDGPFVAAFSARGATKEGILEAAEDYGALLRAHAGPLGLESEARRSA